MAGATLEVAVDAPARPREAGLRGGNANSWAPAVAGGRPRSVARRAGRVALWAFALLLLAATAAAGYLAYEVQQFSDAHAERILPGAVIGDVDVSGMTRAEAIAAVDATLAPQLDRPIELVLEDRTWPTTPRQLGATSNTEEAVDSALRASAAVSFVELARMRWQDAELSFTGQVAVAHTDAGARALVESIAAELAVAPVDATMSYDEEAIAFTPEQEGRGVAVGATTAAVVAALESGASAVEVASVAFAPAVTLADFGQVLYLDQSEFSLELYEDGTLVREWSVATGSGGYPTPTGERYIELKRYLPTWVNPAPDTWGAGSPASIGPGPGNPLGLRALNWSGGDAIRFHGTTAVGSIGTAASHGCVRMHNDDVVELYDLVDVGAKIVSVH